MATDHLLDLFQVIEAAKKKVENTSVNHRVVFVLGNTGDGKSTTINHLLGKKMTCEKIDGKDVVLLSQGESAAAGCEMGTKKQSCTSEIALAPLPQCEGQETKIY